MKRISKVGVSGVVGVVGAGTGWGSRSFFIGPASFASPSPAGTARSRSREIIPVGWLYSGMALRAHGGWAFSLSVLGPTRSLSLQLHVRAPVVAAGDRKDNPRRVRHVPRQSFIFAWAHLCDVRAVRHLWNACWSLRCWMIRSMTGFINYLGGTGFRGRCRVTEGVVGGRGQASAYLAFEFDTPVYA